MNNTEKYSFNSNILSDEYKRYLLERFNDDASLIEIIDDLIMLDIYYYSYEGIIKKGNIVCNKSVEEDLIYIFKTLFENKYQIDKIKLSDEYDFNDMKSMEDNNSSSFNFRKIIGTNKLSKHAYATAIDINPLHNPYVVEDNNNITIYPQKGEIFLDRSINFEHKIDENDLCYKLFIERGFEWGGSWDVPDYQHFQKEPIYKA